jgi:hypothetical protein
VVHADNPQGMASSPVRGAQSRDAVSAAIGVEGVRFGALARRVGVPACSKIQCVSTALAPSGMCSAPPWASSTFVSAWPQQAGR